MQTLTLLHSESFPIGLYADVLTRESIASSRLDSLDHSSSATPLRCAWSSSTRASPTAASAVCSSTRARPSSAWDSTEQPRWLADDSIYLHLPRESLDRRAAQRGQARVPVSLPEAARRSARAAAQRADARAAARSREVGVALSTVRDHSGPADDDPQQGPRALARRRRLALSARRAVDGNKVLRWKLAQNDSIDVEGFEEKILPITRKSLAGYVAMTGETLVIDDAYNLPADAEYEINRSFDETERLPHALAARLPDDEPRRRRDRRAAAHQPQAPRRAGAAHRRERAGRTSSRSTTTPPTSCARWPARPRWPSRTTCSTSRSSACSKASSPPRSRPSSSAIRPPPVTRSASPTSPSSWRASSIASTAGSSPRRALHAPIRSARSATPRCCTTSARSACASRC